MNKQLLPKVQTAVVQAASILFNREATVEKACRLIREAAAQGAQLILFPEAFIPCYPRGLSFGMVVGSRSPAGRQTWQRYWEQAVELPSPTTLRLGQAAQEAGAYVAIGVIERDTSGSRGTLYCTLLYFGPNGRLLGKHRKLKPTAAERLIWGEGDGSTLTVLDTPLGKLGGLICWENYMPLARMTLYAKGVELYLAPTADARDTWQATLGHIACEGRCFVLGCNQFVTKAMYPSDLVGFEELAHQPEIMCRGGSVIISPLGHVLAGPLYDQEGILTATLDLAEVVQGKLDFDVVGHYARPDVFQLRVNEQHYLTLTHFALEQGKLLEAKSWLEKAQDKAPRDSLVLLSQAILCWLENEPEKALPLWQQAKRRSYGTLNERELKYNEFWRGNALAAFRELTAAATKQRQGIE